MNIRPEWWKYMDGSRNRIAEEREKKGWTQHDLAERIGSSISTVSRTESGKIELTEKRLTEIASALGVEPLSLLFDLSVIARTDEEKTWLELGRTLDPEMREAVKQLARAKLK